MAKAKSLKEVAAEGAKDFPPPKPVPPLTGDEDYLTDKQKRLVKEAREQIAVIEQKRGEGENSRLREIIDLPISLEDWYKDEPEEIRELARISYSLNDVLPPAAHYFIARAVVSAIVGKRFLLLNKDRYYYCNVWVCGLAPTGSNKSSVMAWKDELIHFQSKTTANRILQDTFYFICSNKLTNSLSIIATNLFTYS